MKRNFMMIACALVGALSMQAQISDAHVAESKRLFDMFVKGNVVGIAEAMPDADYSFKATPDIRTFGELVAHVADTQARLCSAVGGAPKSVGAASKTTKADLVAALKESVAICDATWGALNGESASADVNLGFLKGSKLMVMEFNTMHSDEEYGYMAVYVRLKGIVPPSSAGRGGRGR